MTPDELATVVQAITARLGDRPPAEGCWLWMGMCPGIPQHRIGSRTYTVRRVMHHARTGQPLSESQVVLATCRTARCVHPAHMTVTERFAPQKAAAARRQEEIESLLADRIAAMPPDACLVCGDHCQTVTECCSRASAWLIETRPKWDWRDEIREAA